MVLTLSEMITLEMLVLPWNALCPMVVTALFVMVSGITTSPPWPVYPVMLTVFVSGGGLTS